VFYIFIELAKTEQDYEQYLVWQSKQRVYSYCRLLVLLMWRECIVVARYIGCGLWLVMLSNYDG